MKGPGIRIDLDVRRLWRCPRCGDERKATGTLTARVCPRAECAGVWMKLIEPLRKPVLRYVAPPHVPIPEEPEAPARSASGENGGRPSRRQRRDGQGQPAEAGSAVPVTPESEAETTNPSETAIAGAGAALQDASVPAPSVPVIETTAAVEPSREAGMSEGESVADMTSASPDTPPTESDSSANS